MKFNGFPSYKKKQKTIRIGNIYRPPQGNVDKFLEIIEDSLIDLDLNKIELLLVGDFNIDGLDKRNPTTKKLIELYKQYGLRQISKEPIRYAEAKDSCIDLCITNSNIISQFRTTNVIISDHQMIMLTRKKLKIKKKRCEFFGRSYRNYNKTEFQRKLQEMQWEEFDMANNVNEKWNSLLNKIKQELSLSCPILFFQNSTRERTMDNT